MALIQTKINYGRKFLSLSYLQLRCIQLLFLLFLLLPFKLQFLKLGLVFSIVGIAFISGKYTLFRKSFIWGFCMMSFNAFYIVYGMLRGNPGYSYYILTYIVWPMLFTVLMGAIPICFIPRITKTLKLGVIIIVASGVFAFLYLNLTGQVSGQILSYKSTIRPGFPFIAISGPQVTDFLFWFFFLFSFIFLSKKKLDYKDILFIGLSIIYIFATSRRILFLNFVIAFILIIIFKGFLPLRRHKIVTRRLKVSLLYITTFIVIAMIWLMQQGLMDPDALSNFIDKTSAASDAARTDQMDALISGWMDNPILGSGTGVNAGIVRSKIPGNYELTYVAKLFETGLIGICIYITLWILLFYWTIKCIAKDSGYISYAIATITAMAIFMISNATNPYLGAFDYMWFMYFPFIYINNSPHRKLIKQISYG